MHAVQSRHLDDIAILFVSISGIADLLLHCQESILCLDRLDELVVYLHILQYVELVGGDGYY